MLYGQFQKIVESISRKRRQRKLRRDSEELGTQEFWRRRERAESRHFKFLKLRFNIRSHIINGRDNVRILRGSAASMLRASVLGILLLVVAVAIDTELNFIPSNPVFSAGTFSGIAVPVTAALLGFYLATVGIILGNAYHDVSSAVRQLILSNRETKLYLSSVGMSIAMGLAIILAENTGITTIGYSVTGLYVLLVCFSGWALAKLALDAFDLFNPITLADEPLQRLYRAIVHLDSKGFLLDDAVLQRTALNADYTLTTLTEIIRLTKERKSVSRDQLARMAQLFLAQMQVYAQRKHRLRPDSGWYIRKPSYPRWVESSQSARDLALRTSTSLQAEYSPVTDWLERRAAELVCAMVEACVITNDRDAALEIIYAASHTSQRLAECSWLDDAIEFSTIISDFIRSLQVNNETVNALSSQPPFLMTGILLGWKNGVASWPEEISHVVETTNWDKRKTTEVQIHGPSRVQQVAQDMLRQVQAEGIIEGHRITPDWYLRSALASEYLLSLREFADGIPKTLERYVGARHVGARPSSPKVQAMAGAAALHMKTTQEIVRRLEDLQKGHDLGDTPEIESLPNSINRLRSIILIQLAQALEQLEPEQVKTDPDWFGQTLFTLLHHTEQAIVDGETSVVSGVFKNILTASLKLHVHVNSTYRPPTYEITSAVLNPVLDLLELSGLAIIYEELGDDESAKPVRNAWHHWRNRELAIETVLNALDIASGIFTPMSMMRTNWETRLVNKIHEYGYSTPTYSPFGDVPVKDIRPPLVRMLGVMETGHSLSLHPYVLFAGEVIGPLSGQSDEKLRTRPGLKHYYETKDFQEGRA